MKNKKIVLISGVFLVLLVGVAVWGFAQKNTSNVDNIRIEENNEQAFITKKMPEADQENDQDEDEVSCESLPGRSYSSVETRPVGMGPDGPVFGFWSISFQEEGVFEWSWSDVVTYGEYTCDADVVVMSHASEVSSEFDVADQVLVWSGVEYSLKN